MLTILYVFFINNADVWLGWPPEWLTRYAGMASNIVTGSFLYTVFALALHLLCTCFAKLTNDDTKLNKRAQKSPLMRALRQEE